MLNDTDIKVVASYINVLVRIEQRLMDEYNESQLEVT
jgi:hypothetical protein